MHRAREVIVHNKVLSQSYKMFCSPYVVSQGHVYCNYTSTSPKLENLPSLPVPKLNDTFSKFIKSVQPHLSETEFATTVSLINNFVKGDTCLKLQNLLEERAAKSHNWLEEWWINSAYLDFRSPVVVYSNPGLVFPERKFQNQNDHLIYAAKTIIAALDYKAQIDGDKIPLEMMGKKPLDMEQYKKIFGTCRIPGINRDSLSYNNSDYITVIHNNHFFNLYLWGEDGIRLNVDQLVKQLKIIVKESEQPCKFGIGVLTSEHRDIWGKAYATLIQDNTNLESLQDIERSIAVLCLDQPSSLWNAKDKDARQTIAAAQTIHGGGASEKTNGSNRWFDKTVQFIVGADGVTGLTYEHSPAEGQPIAVMTDFIIKSIDAEKSPDSLLSSKPIAPRKLQFNINYEIRTVIESAQHNLNKLVSDLELNCFTYKHYGKNFIKSQKLSPDSYLQMAMQYAFYRLHKTPGAHYESAATRMYKGGRTETIRSCSTESVEFAKTMLSAKSSTKDKYIAMQNAIQVHKDYTVQALQGLGVDRHLLGLKLVALENGIEVPDFYKDVGYVKSGHMRISTSQVACKCDAFMCYGPLVPDGYATCYNPRDEDVNFATSSFKSNNDTSVNKYRNALEQSLQDMHDVLLFNTRSKL